MEVGSVERERKGVTKSVAHTRIEEESRECALERSVQSKLKIAKTHVIYEDSTRAKALIAL